MEDAQSQLQRLLDTLGLSADPEVSGTAERVSTLLASFTPSQLPTPTLCETPSQSPIIVRGIPFHSLCAHHLLPFFGTVAVAYRPSGKILGLGSIPRAIAALARRTQIQERLTEQIADLLDSWVSPTSLAVGIRARHLCVEMKERSPGPPVEAIVVAVRGEVDTWLRAQVEDP